MIKSRLWNTQWSVICQRKIKGSKELVQQRLRQRNIDALRTQAAAQLEALIFDCDGVIVESEELHRRAYNTAFKNFDLRVNGEVVNWTEDFYDDLQNKIGGGKPKMRWFFGTNGWPRSNIFDSIPDTEEKQGELIDIVQDWKSKAYRDLIDSGEVKPRPGILRLMAEARNSGIKLAVCSAATKESVICVLYGVLGQELFESLDCFLAGDDVKEKKPSPMIYRVASGKLRVPPERCIVIEDSAIGLAASIGAEMKCIVTYTNSTKNQAFNGALLVVPNLDTPSPITIERLLLSLEENKYVS